MIGNENALNDVEAAVETVSVEVVVAGLGLNDPAAPAGRIADGEVDRAGEAGGGSDRDRVRRRIPA